MPPRLQPLSGLSRNGTSRVINLPLRSISTTPAPAQEVTSEPPASTPAAVLLDPNLVSTRQQELKLQRTQHANPVGSRRRRAALQHAANIPFTQLPYQCFQEARKILQADREDKLKQIAAQRAKIERLSATETPKDDQGAVHYKAKRLRSMRDHLEKLKIHADINDPVVKKKFEDGQGDMTKPIYRFLADRKWRELKRKIVMQRITQMSVVPDVLPSLDPVVDLDVSFGRRRYPPGEFVPSIISEQAPRINLQVFSAGEKTVTLAVVDSDVPNLETDGFDNRCHFLASNIKISATTKSINLANLTEGDVILPWVPPTAQKGAPYHRLSVIVLEQHMQGGTADLINKDTALAKWPAGKGFKLRDYASNNRLRATGVTMFRTQWDEYMDGVMRRQGIADVDMELKRRRVDPLPYKWTPKMGKKYR